MILVSYGYTRGEIKKILANKKLLTSTDEVRSIDPTSWEKNSIEEIIQTQGLFVEKEIFFIDHVVSESEPEEIFKNIKKLKETTNLIIFIEDEESKVTEKLEKEAEHVLRAGKRTEEKPFNVFALTDALFERDKKKFWILYQKALNEGVDLEFDVHRIIFWGVKMLALSKEYNSAVSAGISPFVYSKAKSGVVKYKDGEIEKISQNLTEMVVSARQGEDWEILLEKFVLSL